MSTSSRAVFLDRDGTINRDFGYLSDPRKLYIYSNAGKAIKLLSNAGFKVMIVTNQSGIGRGQVKKYELKNINRRLKGLLAKDGAKIDAIYICPHHPDENCDCRKPRPALIKKAAREFNLNLSRSYIIGDKLSDVETKEKAGLSEGILVLTGLGRRSLREAKKTKFKLGPVCRDILSAAKLICKFNAIPN